MGYEVKDYMDEIKEQINNNAVPESIDDELRPITKKMDVDELEVKERVRISRYALELLSDEQRMQMAKALIQEQIVNQREELTFWSTVTAQSCMIDTGYIAQHLVSLCTKIPGQGMRGKGLDLCDGSEVKAANFIDSKDKKGATEPRWNFSSPKDKLENFLHYKYIYLVSIDYSPERNMRIRIWRVDMRKHVSLRKRYREWMNLSTRDSNNFQLFPPKSEENSIYARHGSSRPKSLPPVEIALENVQGAEKIFHAEIVNDDVVIKIFK